MAKGKLANFGNKKAPPFKARGVGHRFPRQAPKAKGK